MNVPDALPGVIAVVHDQPVVVRVAGIRRDAPDDLEEPSAKALVLEIGEPRDMHARHHEHVEWCRGVAIRERDRIGVLMHECGRDLARDDAAEHAVTHGS